MNKKYLVKHKSRTKFGTKSKQEVIHNRRWFISYQLPYPFSPKLLSGCKSDAKLIVAGLKILQFLSYFWYLTCPAKRKCLTFCLSILLELWKCFNQVPNSEASKNPLIPAAGTKTYWKEKRTYQFFRVFQKFETFSWH